MRSELNAYNPEMLKKPFIVALNKVDELGAEEQLEKFYEQYPFPKETLFPISAMLNEGVSPLLDAMRQLAQAGGRRFK